VLCVASEFAPRPLARLSWRRTRLGELRNYGPAATQEELVNGSYPAERTAPFGESGGLDGGCIRCLGVECAVSFGLDRSRTPSSRHRVEGFGLLRR
jgi:hypothetical protein